MGGKIQFDLRTVPEQVEPVARLSAQIYPAMILDSLRSAADVVDLGWFHPAGARYVASMFRDERTGSLHGVAAPNSNGTRSFEWVSRTPGGEASAVALRFGTGTQLPTGALLYGSMARDAAGNVYVAGTMAYKPLIVQVAAFH